MFVVGEVVAIWRTFDSVQETRIAANTMRNDNDISNLKVEIRWFYRQGELSTAPESYKTELEEIFETDQVDECCADCILAPAKLMDRDKLHGPSQILQGMPVVEFICRRFWSVHRGSLIPCGGLSGRTQRAWIHSKYLGKDAELQTAFRRISANALPETTVDLPQSDSDLLPWRAAFSNVIKKLTLTDASDSSKFQGAGLIGRDKEQKQIFTFLRDAVCGKSKIPSLFVGGPPGMLQKSG
jgi:hypothetical protein